MRVRLDKGQEAVEFILISALVFFACLGVFMLFGDKIGAFFNSDSSVVKTSKDKVAVVSSQKYTSSVNPGGSISPVNNLSTPVKVAGYDGYQNSDGSMTFNIDGQKVNITKNMADLSNTVFQTTGTDGTSTLLKEIAYMIKQNGGSAENPVDIEVSFGTGERAAPSTTYQGTAEVNSFSLKAADQVIMVQKDQGCSSSVVEGYSSCNFKGTYRMEGTISNNKLNASVTGVVASNGENIQGSIVDGTVSGLPDSMEFSAPYTQTNTTAPYQWNLTFNNPDNSFKI